MPRNPWKKGGSNITTSCEAVGESHFFGLVSYTIFGASEEHFIHASRLPAMSERNSSFIVDTLAFTDRKNTNSTSREEPPKMSFFMKVGTRRATWMTRGEIALQAGRQRSPPSGPA